MNIKHFTNKLEGKTEISYEDLSEEEIIDMIKLEILVSRGGKFYCLDTRIIGLEGVMQSIARKTVIRSLGEILNNKNPSKLRHILSTITSWIFITGTMMVAFYAIIRMIG